MQFRFPSLKEIAIGFIGAFFILQILSVVISSIFPIVPLFKGGNVILLMLLSIAIMTLFIIGTNIEELKKKETLAFVVIVFGLLGLAYWKLPEYLPILFSISPDASIVVKETIASIFGGVG